MGKQFPVYLSKPYQILWFEPDDLGIALVFFALAMIYGGFFWIPVFVAPWFYSKTKAAYPRGFFKHLLYFCGIHHFKMYPTFFERRFLE